MAAQRFSFGRVAKCTASGPPRPGSTTSASRRCVSRWRLLGQLRVPERPGDDEPPLRAALHRAALHRRRRTTSPGFFAKYRKGEVKCPDMEIDQLVDITRRHRPVDAATKGLEAARLPRAPYKAELVEDREGMRDRRRRSAATSLTSTTAAATIFTSTSASRTSASSSRRSSRIAFFGGVSGQLHVPPLRPRRLVPSGLRGRQARSTPGPLPMVAGRAKEGDSRSSPATRATRGGSPSPSSSYLRDVALPRAALPPRRAARASDRVPDSAGPSRSAFDGAGCSGWRTSLKAIGGARPRCAIQTLRPQGEPREQELRAQVEATPAMQQEVRRGLGRYRQSRDQACARSYRPTALIEGGAGFCVGRCSTTRGRWCALAEELPKPNEQRLREYRDSQLPALKQKLFSTAPIYDELEILTLTLARPQIREEPVPTITGLVKKVLGKELAATSSPPGRRQGDEAQGPGGPQGAFEGGKSAIDASKDPMIEFARLVDPDARAVRKAYEDDVEAVVRRNARADRQGALRDLRARASIRTRPSRYAFLRRGAGWTEGGEPVPPVHHLRAAPSSAPPGAMPFALPTSWIEAQSQARPGDARSTSSPPTTSSAATPARR